MTKLDEKKAEINKKLGELNSVLRENFVDTKQVSIYYWNNVIAPNLSRLAQVIDKTHVTARTFRLPENYFEGEEETSLTASSGEEQEKE